MVRRKVKTASLKSLTAVDEVGAEAEVDALPARPKAERRPRRDGPPPPAADPPTWSQTFFSSPFLSFPLLCSPFVFFLLPSFPFPLLSFPPFHLFPQLKLALGVPTSFVQRNWWAVRPGSSTRGSLGRRFLCLYAFSFKLASQPWFLESPSLLPLACLWACLELAFLHGIPDLLFLACFEFAFSLPLACL